MPTRSASRSCGVVTDQSGWIVTPWVRASSAVGLVRHRTTISSGSPPPHRATPRVLRVIPPTLTEDRCEEKTVRPVEVPDIRPDTGQGGVTPAAVVWWLARTLQRTGSLSTPQDDRS